MLASDLDHREILELDPEGGVIPSPHSRRSCSMPWRWGSYAGVSSRTSARLPLAPF